MLLHNLCVLLLALMTLVASADTIEEGKLSRDHHLPGYGEPCNQARGVCCKSATCMRVVGGEEECVKPYVCCDRILGSCGEYTPYSCLRHGGRCKKECENNEHEIHAKCDDDDDDDYDDDHNDDHDDDHDHHHDYDKHDHEDEDHDHDCHCCVKRCKENKSCTDILGHCIDDLDDYINGTLLSTGCEGHKCYCYVQESCECDGKVYFHNSVRPVAKCLSAVCERTSWKIYRHPECCKFADRYYSEGEMRFEGCKLFKCVRGNWDKISSCRHECCPDTTTTTTATTTIPAV
ncbi:uncharacterized protein LOC121878362 [Homarus americanus]|uniref:uncharacterized protein LOC121878362 n=1 Tax=Homarus americanus TaxID=6706 RepID=UPI001C441F2B|nr:uncharacterized protein LOC121878362 [Homarus americanus]